MSEAKKTFDEPANEETVARNLFSFSGDIYQDSDVRRFLEIASYEKVMSIRFIAWLSALKIIEGDRVKWMPDIMRAISYHDRCVKRYFKNSFYNPLETINDGPTIRAAVESSMEFFKKIAFSETYINEEIFSDAQLRVSRAIATVAIDNESYKFQKGDERIFMVAYSCALGFARRGTLTNYFAECFAFHIGSILVSSLSTHRRIMELKVDDDFTADFLHHMRRFANPTIKFMKKEGIDPVAINRECISTMFTYCFEGDDIFLMFDSIILELKGYRKYANFIVLAIFRQIENKGGRYETERVVPDQPLCAVDILDDVYAMQNTKEINFLKMFIDNACPCFNGLSFLFGTGKLF